MRLCQTILCFLPVFALSQISFADDYLQHVKPILQHRCYSCHGVLKQEGGLRLDTAKSALKGADSGAVIVPHQASTSELLQRLKSTDDSVRMPPEGEPLKPAEIAAIEAWITTGAKAPADEAPERDPKDHWAFQTPIRPVIPANSNHEWNLNPLDSFVSSVHQRRGLSPQPPASRSVLLRRVTQDLIGLPPTSDELQSFLQDDSADALERVTDRLLASPHYGERWARHWMDIWRYSDWWGLGNESRNSQRHIWHWRDWIIESLNSDKGYDQMLREMLAADEIYPEDADKLRAGGFLGRQYFKFNRTSWMDETIEHTAKAMLGLTFNCAKCHDHKYDPFSQADYYRFRAIFEPYQIRLDATNGHVDFDKDGIPRPFDCNLDAKTYLHIRGDDRNPDTSRLMEPAVPTFLSKTPITINPVQLPAVAIQPGLKSFVVDAYLKQAETLIETRRAELNAARARLDELEKQERKVVHEIAQSDPHLTFSDNFTSEQSADWQAKTGRWIYENSQLKQTVQGSEFAALRLNRQVPADFEAALTFIPREGQTWKSVGMTFDGADADVFCAYLSAHIGGSKAQVSYKKEAQTYPAEAAKAQSVELNQTYKLTVRVRSSVVNLLVNDQLQVAYRLPIDRQPGTFQLMTYDCAADFQSFELKPLASTIAVTEPKKDGASSDSPWNLEQANLNIRIAQRAFDWAVLQPDSIRIRSQADFAGAYQPQSDEARTLALQSAQSERQLAAIKAEEAVARAEFELSRAAAGKTNELEAKLKAARTLLDESLRAIDEISDQYTPVRGASKIHESNLETEDSRLKPYPATSSGRRTGLAHWITDPNNPLTSRVAVNHLWSRHFGSALVTSVFDFGRKGAAPSNQDLLDWLAIELTSPSNQKHGNSEWNMKRIHRLIVTTSTYRMSSSQRDANPANLATDAENRFYWRMNPIRMQSQSVRDALLSLANELDFSMSGPPIDVSQERANRRSIYFFHSNIQRERFLSMFDDASVLDCYRRAESIVPQQALALENSPLATEMAAKIAQRVSERVPSGSTTDFVQAAYQTVLSVEPNPDETKLMVNAIGQMQQAAVAAKRANPESDARAALVQALLNHNDFVTVR